MSSCDPCDPSLGSLEDIFLAQIYCADLTFVVFFLLSFVVIYSLNVTYIASFSSFQSFFPCVLLSLSSTFYLSSLYVFLSISSTFSFCLCLSFTFFLAHLCHWNCWNKVRLGIYFIKKKKQSITGTHSIEKVDIRYGWKLILLKKLR